MTGVKISALPPAGVLAGNEAVAVVQSGVTRRTTLADCLSFGGLLSSATSGVVTNSLNLPGALTYSGASGTPTSSKLLSYTSLSGTVTASATTGSISPFDINIGGDAAITGGVGITYLSVRAAASANRTGGRTGIQGSIIVTGAPAVGEFATEVGVTGIVTARVNQGGTGVSYITRRGSLFGGNFNAFTLSSNTATNLALINGCEFNTTLATGNSAADKYGISIVKGAGDAVRGTFDDCAISINDQVGSSAGWACGLKFGGYGHQWAFATDSTLIGAATQTLPSAQPSPALYGIDLSAITITAGGAGVVMPLITPASAAATGKVGSIVWDAGFIYVCTATNTWKRAAIATW